MQTNETPRYEEVQVSGDWLAEDAEMTRFASFSAKVRLDENGRRDNWNGFLEPLFSLDEAKRLRDWLDAAGVNLPDAGFDRLAITEDEEEGVGVEVIPFDAEAYDGVETFVPPIEVDGEVRYQIGSGWTWTEAYDETPDERGTGPDRYPTILRDSSGRPTDIG